MRMIGHVENESSARAFGDFLCVQGIDHSVEFESGTGWAIWIRDEDKLSDAQKHLSAFQANPGDTRFVNQAGAAQRKREQSVKEEEAYRKRVVDGRTFFRSLAGYGLGPVSLILILASIAVAILSRLGDDLQPVAMLLISEYLRPTLPEIKAGEVWRLVTPIFLHFGLLHLLFNLLWLRDLGSLIEARHSPWFLLVQVVLIAAVSNLAQYYQGGPGFGGMSGVVYGLLGYVWIRSKVDPGSGFFVHPTTVTIMLIWLVVCYTGLVGRVANTAHLVGLMVGAGWGYVAGIRRG